MGCRVHLMDKGNIDLRKSGTLQTVLDRAHGAIVAVVKMLLEGQPIHPGREVNFGFSFRRE
ncbi:hypothetical protein D3C85_1851030 [compost metagenome]